MCGLMICGEDSKYNKNHDTTKIYYSTKTKVDIFQKNYVITPANDKPDLVVNISLT